jgi:cholesterol transport system auxiliary component
LAFTGRYRVALAIVASALVAGCTLLETPSATHTATYVLDALPRQQTTSGPSVALALGPLQARAGFDTPGIVYARRPHELEYFATHRWADTPARMLAPLVAKALEQAGGFRVLMNSPTAVPADVRLEMELVRLQHEFAQRPSRVRLTLQIRLIEVRSKRLLESVELDEVEPAPSDDPYGGVVAANRALARALERLIAFATRAATARVQ